MPTSAASNAERSTSRGTVRRSKDSAAMAHDTHTISSGTLNTQRANESAAPCAIANVATVVAAPARRFVASATRTLVEANHAARTAVGHRASRRYVLKVSATSSHPSAAATYRSRGHRPDATRQTRIAKTRGVTCVVCLCADRVHPSLGVHLRRVSRLALRARLEVLPGILRSKVPSAAACRGARDRDCLFAWCHGRMPLLRVQFRCVLR